MTHVVHGSNTTTPHAIWSPTANSAVTPKITFTLTALFQLPAAAVTDDEVELIWKESIVKTDVQIVELFEDIIEPIKRLLLTTVAGSVSRTIEVEAPTMRKPFLIVQSRYISTSSVAREGVWGFQPPPYRNSQV
jgi:hypothetical protein